MKKKLLLIVVILLLFSCSKDKKAWQTAIIQNNIESYQKYITDFPDGKNLDFAQKKIDSILLVIELDNKAWEKATKEKKQSSYQAYLTNYPNGIYATKADSIIQIMKLAEANDEKAWLDAVAENTFFSYKNYIDNYYHLHLEEATKITHKKFKEIINKEFKVINEFFATVDFIQKQGDDKFEDSLFYYFSNISCNYLDKEIEGGINYSSLRVSEFNDYSYALSYIKYFIKQYKKNEFYEFEIKDYDTKPIIYFSIVYTKVDSEYTLEIEFTEENGEYKITYFYVNIDTPGC